MRRYTAYSSVGCSTPSPLFLTALHVLGIVPPPLRTGGRELSYFIGRHARAEGKSGSGEVDVPPE